MYPLPQLLLVHKLTASSFCIPLHCLICYLAATTLVVAADYVAETRVNGTDTFTVKIEQKDWGGVAGAPINCTAGPGLTCPNLIMLGKRLPLMYSYMQSLHCVVVPLVVAVSTVFCNTIWPNELLARREEVLIQASCTCYCTASFSSCIARMTLCYSAAAVERRHYANAVLCVLQVQRK
jgi:hypothetical protein